MALFKFRKGRDEQPAPVAPAQTVEAVRRRAMHRLIGAAVLVLIAVIGFPILFDNQPRPIPVDLPIEIVDRNKVRPLAIPPATAITSASAVPGGATQSATAPGKSADPQTDAAASTTPATPAMTTDVAKAAPQPDAPDPRGIDAKKARALLEGRAPAGGKTAPEAAAVAVAKPAARAPAVDAAAKAPASNDRFVVQIGAFAEQAKVREVRRKVEAAGLKTYTQVVGTTDGDRTRVRVGPYTDKTEAVKAAEQIRKLDLPAAILTL